MPLLVRGCPSVPNVVKFDGVPLSESPNVVDVVCGNNHTVAMTSEGAVFTWGFGAPASASLPPPLPHEGCLIRKSHLFSPQLSGLADGDSCVGGCPAFRSKAESAAGLCSCVAGLKYWLCGSSLPDLRDEGPV